MTDPYRDRYLESVFLPSQNAIIITQDGDMSKGIVHQESDFLDYADVIQGMLINALKFPGAKKGRWVWIITDDWSSLEGFGRDENGRRI